MNQGRDHAHLALANAAQPSKDVAFFALPGCGERGRQLHPLFAARRSTTYFRWVEPGTWGFLDGLKGTAFAWGRA